MHKNFIKKKTKYKRFDYVYIRNWDNFLLIVNILIRRKTL